MAFDGIVTKAIASELQQLSGARIDKIFQPNKNTVLLGFYLNGSNYLLNICMDSQNYRINLTTHAKPNPKVAPNFCMVLRKHLLGLHIKNFITNHLERIVIIELEGFNDIDDLISKKLIIELMGKHCNIILLDEQNIIIDSLRHIYKEDNFRNIVPHIPYQYPTTTKFNFLDCLTFSAFFEKLVPNTSICDLFNGISKTFIDTSLDYLKITKLDETSLTLLYDYIKDIIHRADTNLLTFKVIGDSMKKDYILIPSKTTNPMPFSLNYFIDDFYTQKEETEELKNNRNRILKIILELLKKYKKRLFHMDEKLNSCQEMEKYHLYGELLTANLYQIKNENLKEITLNNYYDGKEIVIPLDVRYTPSVNAKLFFKKYRKLKSALAIVTLQKEETQKELTYLESIVYELENCSTIDEVFEIWDEISENIIFKEKTKSAQKSKIKKSTLTKNKKVSFNPLKYNIDGYTLLIGRNNKENDYLTLKYAKKTDLWFHTKDIHGSHAILQLHDCNCFPKESILITCAQMVAYHSKAKNSSNVPVDFCEVKYVKKINGAKPGMVTYRQQKTLYVEPKKCPY